jgi:hypothetical protein
MTIKEFPELREGMNINGSRERRAKDEVMDHLPGVRVNLGNQSVNEPGNGTREETSEENLPGKISR